MFAERLLARNTKCAAVGIVHKNQVSQQIATRNNIGLRLYQAVIARLIDFDIFFRLLAPGDIAADHE